MTTPHVVILGAGFGGLAAARALKGAPVRVTLIDRHNYHKVSGFFAWLFWLFLHVVWLIGFRNRVAVLGEWAWAYLTFQPRARLITGEKLSPRS